MDEDFWRRWCEASVGVWMRAHPGGGDGYEPAVRGGHQTTLTMMRRKLPGLSAEWSQAQREALVTRILGNHLHDDAHATRTFRCVRLGHALASGSAAHLSEAEAALLADMGHDLSDATQVGGPAAPPHGPSFDLDVRFAYSGVPRGRRVPRPMAGATRVTVDRLNASDFDETLDLRMTWGWPVRAMRQGGQWFRTVMGPDGRRPVDEASFVDACSGREPWADDPFADPASRTVTRQTTPLAVLEGTLRADDQPADAAALEAAARLRVAGAGRVASVDGTVMVPTTAPTYHLAVRTTRRPPHGNEVVSLRLAWRLGHLTSESQIGILPTKQSVPVDWSCGLETRSGLVVGAFPLGSARVAAEFVRRVSMHTGHPSATAADDLPPLRGDARDALRDVLGSLLTVPTRRGGPRHHRAFVEGVRGALDGWSADGLRKAAETVSVVDSRGYVHLHDAVVRGLCEVAAMTVEGAFEPDLADEDEAVIGFAS